jgi:hypothetical protein
VPDVSLVPRSLIPAFAPGGPDRHARSRRPPGRPWVVVLGQRDADATHRRLVSVWPDALRDDATAATAVPLRLAEPCDRGTATSALRAAHWVHWRDPLARVAVLLGVASEIKRVDLRASLAAVDAFVRTHPLWSVLLDACEPEGVGEWIEPGEPFGLAGTRLLRRVRRLAPVSDASRIRTLVTRASTLVELGRRRLPEMSDALTHAARFAGPVEDSWLLRRAYASSAPRDLLGDLLPHALPHVAVGQLRPGGPGSRRGAASSER